MPLNTRTKLTFILFPISIIGVLEVSDVIPPLFAVRKYIALKLQPSLF